MAVLYRPYRGVALEKQQFCSWTGHVVPFSATWSRFRNWARFLAARRVAVVVVVLRAST